MYEMPPTLAAMLDTPIIPFQPTLPKVLPTIEGNVDYRDLRDQLLRMDELLLQSGLETRGCRAWRGPAARRCATA